MAKKKAIDQNINQEKLSSFFQRSFQKRTFANHQIHDFEGLKGRVLSSSYMPAEGDESYESMIDDLKALFAKHAEDGKIAILYDTNVFCSQF